MISVPPSGGLAPISAPPCWRTTSRARLEAEVAPRARPAHAAAPGSARRRAAPRGRRRRRSRSRRRRRTPRAARAPRFHAREQHLADGRHAQPEHRQVRGEPGAQRCPPETSARRCAVHHLLHQPVEREALRGGGRAGQRADQVAHDAARGVRALLHAARRPRAPAGQRSDRCASRRDSAEMPGDVPRQLVDRGRDEPQQARRRRAREVGPPAARGRRPPGRRARARTASRSASSSPTPMSVAARQARARVVESRRGRGRATDLQRDQAARPRASSGGPARLVRGPPARPPPSRATRAAPASPRTPPASGAARWRPGRPARRRPAPPRIRAPRSSAPPPSPPNSRLSRPYVQPPDATPVRRKSAAAHAVRPKPTTACASSARARQGCVAHREPARQQRDERVRVREQQQDRGPAQQRDERRARAARGRSGRTSSAAAQASTERPTSALVRRVRRAARSSGAPQRDRERRHGREQRAAAPAAPRRTRARRGPATALRASAPRPRPAPPPPARPRSSARGPASVGQHREHQRDRRRRADTPADSGQGGCTGWPVRRSRTGSRSAKRRAGRRRLQHHRAAVVAGDEVHLGESEPDALAHRPRGEERIEDLRAHLGRHARPVVGEAQRELARVVRRR